MSDVVSRLLAAIDEKERGYLERARDWREGMSDDELHQRCAHPAYEYATTEGQRKAWDDADTPPEGDGWELNATTADPDAFERFDYHEERHWRRLNPDGPQVWTPPAEVTEGLRLCQAHRDIVAEWQKQRQMGRQIEREEGLGSDTHFTSVGVVAGLWAAVTLLARGYGVEDGEDR